MGRLGTHSPWSEYLPSTVIGNIRTGKSKKGAEKYFCGLEAGHARTRISDSVSCRVPTRPFNGNLGLSMIAAPVSGCIRGTRHPTDSPAVVPKQERRPLLLGTTARGRALQNANYPCLRTALGLRGQRDERGPPLGFIGFYLA
jgi:hypothetical protein